ncbi:hypothetical protein ANN_12409 [Periplaneta americana]|uniref:Uncharacterized protein n=1 Tax=Periplaneta americana TaxID=6978 RepID=A0ABQ8TH22_PERAM|nr:hypothetical protein ANN_12409 [Periplaneta americana]
MEFIPEGATVNKTRYKEILGRLRDSIRRTKAVKQYYERIRPAPWIVSRHGSVGKERSARKAERSWVRFPVLVESSLSLGTLYLVNINFEIYSQFFDGKRKYMEDYSTLSTDKICDAVYTRNNSFHLKYSTTC